MDKRHTRSAPNDGRWLIALGVAGMLGFVGSFIAAITNRFGTVAYLCSVALSLSAYLASVALGYLSELRERPRRAKTPAVAPRNTPPIARRRVTLSTRRLAVGVNASLPGDNVLPFARPGRQARTRTRA